MTFSLVHARDGNHHDQDRQVQERHKTKKKMQYYAFLLDLQKAFDKVKMDVVRRALRRLGVDKWIIRTVMETCHVVRTETGPSERFEVTVGLHQWVVLSPLLFTIVMDVVSSEARGGLSSEFCMPMT